jgi:hypothetical protein
MSYSDEDDMTLGHVSAGSLQMHAAASDTRERVEGESLEEPPMEVWLSEPMQDCDFSHEDESPCDDPNWCFVCYVMESQTNSQGSQNYNIMLNFIEDNKSKISPRALVHQVQHFYNTHLRSKVNGQKFWTRQMIWEHIEKHAPSNTIILLDFKRTYYEGMMRLRDNGLFTRECSSNKKGINYNAFNMYIKIEKQMNSVMNKLKDSV